MPSLSKATTLKGLEHYEIADYVYKNMDVLTKEICQYLIEHPYYCDFDIFKFPFYTDVADGLAKGMFVESSLNSVIVKAKAELIQMTFTLNKKMIEKTHWELSDIDEDLLLRAIECGLIIAKIGSGVELQYCRPPGKQEWLLNQVTTLKKRLEK